MRPLDKKKRKYRVPFVDYRPQYRNLKEEIDKAIQNVLNRGDFILRSDVEDFEKNIANFLGAKYAVGVNSCTDAMIFSLRAAGIGPGDEVITVSHTFFATIEAIHHVGAEPILVDVKDDYLIDETKIERAITRRTKAIMPVHLNGRVCEMDRIKEIARKNKLLIIEDAAQALGAKLKTKKSGWKKAGIFGLAGCFSFYPAKILGAMGDAGAVVTNDKNIAEKVRLLRNHGQATKTKIICYGFTSRLHNIQAAILNIKFGHLPEFIKRRREVAKIYNNGLSKIPNITLPPAPNFDSRHFDVYQNYVIRAEKRDNLFSYLTEKGVETLIKDPVPNHWHKNLNLFRFRLPLTEQLSREVISLPMYSELADPQVRYVISCVKKFCAQF